MRAGALILNPGLERAQLVAGSGRNFLLQRDVEVRHTGSAEVEDVLRPHRGSHLVDQVRHLELRLEVIEADAVEKIRERVVKIREPIVGAPQLEELGERAGSSGV